MGFLRFTLAQLLGAWEMAVRAACSPRQVEVNQLTVLLGMRCNVVIVKIHLSQGYKFQLYSSGSVLYLHMYVVLCTIAWCSQVAVIEHFSKPRLIEESWKFSTSL